VLLVVNLVQSIPSVKQFRVLYGEGSFEQFDFFHVFVDTLSAGDDAVGALLELGEEFVSEFVGVLHEDLLVGLHLGRVLHAVPLFLLQAEEFPLDERVLQFETGV